MMSRVSIKITRAFRGNAVGSEMRVSAHEARFLVLSNHAEYITTALTPEKVAVTAALVELTTDSTEPSADDEASGEESDGVEISPRTGLPKRQYRRRDLTAE